MWIILQDFIAITKGLIKKGTDINTVDKKILDINQKINQKKRKILGYLPAEQLFVKETGGSVK